MPRNFLDANWSALVVRFVPGVDMDSDPRIYDESYCRLERFKP